MIKQRFFTQGRLYVDITGAYRRFGLMLYKGYNDGLFNDSHVGKIAPELNHYNNFFTEPDFNEYGKVSGERKKSTINLTQIACNLMRSLIMNEVDNTYGITIKDDVPVDEEKTVYKKRQWFIDALVNNNFRNQEGDLLEYSLAMGDGLRMPYIENNRPKISFVKSNKYEVVEEHNGIPKGIVLSTIKIEYAGKKKSKKKYYTLLEYHRFLEEDTIMEIEPGNPEKFTAGHHVWREIYVAKNRYYLDDYVPFKDKMALFNMTEEEEHEFYNVDTPLFVFTRMPFANNKDTDSVRGIGMTINAIDSMHTINNAFDADNNETEDMAAKTFMPEEWLTTFIDSDGKQNKVFNKRTRNFVGLNMGEHDMNKPETYAPAMRDVSYTNKIQRNLKIFNHQIKLDPSTIKFEHQSATTATQVKLEHKRTHDTRAEIANLLEQSWKELLWSMYRMAKLMGKQVIGWELKKEDIKVRIPDGIIVDDKELFDQDIIKLDKGILSAQTIRKRWENMGETESDEEQALIDGETAPALDLDIDET